MASLSADVTSFSAVLHPLPLDKLCVRHRYRYRYTERQKENSWPE